MECSLSFHDQSSAIRLVADVHLVQWTELRAPRPILVMSMVPIIISAKPSSGSWWRRSPLFVFVSTATGCPRRGIRDIMHLGTHAV